MKNLENWTGEEKLVFGVDIGTTQSVRHLSKTILQAQYPRIHSSRLFRFFSFNLANYHTSNKYLDGLAKSTNKRNIKVQLSFTTTARVSLVLTGRNSYN